MVPQPLRSHEEANSLEPQKQRMSSRYLATLMLVGAVKLTLPAAVAIILRRQLARWWLGRLSAARAISLLMARHLFRLGVTVEAYFFVYYLLQKYRLAEVDVQLPPLQHAGDTKSRKRYLERCLSALDDICGKPCSGPSGGMCQGMVTDKPSSASADALLRSISSKNCLRTQHVHSRPTGLLQRMATADCLIQSLTSKNSGFLKRPAVVPSMEDLLRWKDEGDLDTEEEDDAVLQLTFKRAELSSWFFNAPIEHITRGNIAQWVAEYFFSNSTPESLRCEPDTRLELDELVECVVSWAQLEGTAGGAEPNPRVSCMRLLHDPLPSAHRPFWVYLITHLVLPQITRTKLLRLGFRRYRSGAMIYWLRRGARRKADSPQAPLVFCHGLGVGMLPYVAFVQALVDQHPASDVFCVDMPHIQMRPCEHVPSAREMCASIGDMLLAWGHSSAHIVGHSFGTIVCSWLVRYSPAMVKSVAFLDPVCFLLCKSDLILNSLYAPMTSPWKQPGVWLLTFLVFRELYICHTLTRNFFWQQNNLWPEDLRGIQSLIILGGSDPLVPARSVRQMFEVHEERLRLSSKALASGDAVVIQSKSLAWHSPSASARDCHDEPRVDLAPEDNPVRIVFAPDAYHGQFWRDSAMFEQVLKEVADSIRRGDEARER
eukprot:TRINITY_DN38215_c0_g1_i1.p1 TRINITY_DN38215_c0_g1~~TRINITY_DN38215_c0_g1_i1.p1  ORF type:complete len:684 (-),score=92.36 TRINITY_DN38215_c0_g1_i1:54-2027(-)